MDPQLTHRETQGPDIPPVSAPEPTLFEEIGSSLLEVVRLVHDQMRLATLEARLAGESLVAMLIAGIMIAILLASAWLGVMTAAVLVLIGLGVAGSVAILLAIAVNLVVALILYRVIRHKSRHLQFAGTLRSLRSLRSDSGAS
jgi:uncharacterized membrane protein YqjE